jgi:DNA-binding SARP family transcriptional activator
VRARYKRIPMQFKILGPLAIEADGRQIQPPGLRQRALLVILLLHQGEVVSAERLIEELYGSEPPPSAATSLRAHISRLRSTLGREDVLITRARGYALELQPGAVDSERFEQLVDAARRQRAAGSLEAAAASLREALALWRGPPLVDFAYEGFAQPEIARLEELRLTAIEEQAQVELDLGRHVELVGTVERLVREFPLRERLRGQLMLALYRSGRQAEALEAFQEVREKLVHELGIEPGAELRELQRAILRQDAALELARAPRRAGATLPRERDADLVLLERDSELAALAEAAEAAAGGEGRVVLVSGEPGIGKTSLVTRFLREQSARGRVLFCTCDDLSIPRPLGPLRDLLGSVSPPLEEALCRGEAPHSIHALLIAELALPPGPTVLALEDVHWADEATCDAITVVGRRIGSLPALLVLTYRGGEARPGHPLYAAIGEIRAETSVFLELAPLSETAVATLADGDAGELYAATGGNPFYVTELLASRTGARMPASVANSVVARASRLDATARRLVELVSVVPSRVATSLLDAVMPDWAAAAEEPERRQLLEVEPRWVRFRHELARNAIATSIPVAARRRHHAEILHALLEADADPADIVHHAEAAGADAVVGEYALLAARQAVALESNLEAYSYYASAASFVDRLPPSEQAAALEDMAMVAYAVGRLEEAFHLLERAMERYEELANESALGRCRRTLSRLHWYAGEGTPARERAREAIDTLEPLGETIELARAYSVASQLAMLDDDATPALHWGRRALDLAARLGDERTRAHALVDVGSVKVQLDPDAAPVLLEAHAIAHAAGDPHEATRALNNLASRSLSWARPDAALRYAEMTVAYADEHQVHTIGSYAATLIAWLRLRSGDWAEAERVARIEVERGVGLPVLSAIVLAELAVRRGDEDAVERLNDASTQADRAGELHRIVPVLELAAERALTSGAAMPTERLAELADQIPPRGTLVGRLAIRVAAWAAVAGIESEYSKPKSAPYAAMQRRDWKAAADAFGDIGWSYDRALMLSLLDDEPALIEAMGIARELGARPLAERVAARLRELGSAIPSPLSS